MGLLFSFAVVLIAIMAGIMAVDMAHVSAVTDQLQNAADAAALAGARDIDIDDRLAEFHALEVASQNTVDGLPLINDPPQTTVAVSVTPSSRALPGYVEVTATATVRHILAPIVGRFSDTVTVTSVAGPSGTIRTVDADRTFPLAVSVNAVPSDGAGGRQAAALNKSRLTDTVTLFVDNQEAKNAAFTTFDEDPENYEHLRGLVDSALDVDSGEPVSVPAVSSGDTIRLCDGIVGQRHLLGAPQYNAMLSDRVVILPVIGGYPQQQTEAAVVGFIGAKIVDAKVDSQRGVVSSIDIKLIKNVPRMKAGALPSTGRAEDDAALSHLSPGTLKLLPRDVVAAAAVASMALPPVLRAPPVSSPLRGGGWSAAPGTSAVAPAPVAPGSADRDGKASRIGELSARPGRPAPRRPATGAQTGRSPEVAALFQQAYRYSAELSGRAALSAGPSGVESHAVSSGAPGGLAAAAAALPATVAGAGRTSLPGSAERPAATQDIQEVTAAPEMSFALGWGWIALLWLAVAVVLASRSGRRTASQDSFSAFLALPMPAIKGISPAEPQYGSLKDRLSTMRLRKEAAQSLAASSDQSSILSRMRLSSNPWAGPRLGRIRSLRYWGLGGKPASAQSEHPRVAAYRSRQKRRPRSPNRALSGGAAADAEPKPLIFALTRWSGN